MFRDPLGHPRGRRIGLSGMSFYIRVGKTSASVTISLTALHNRGSWVPLIRLLPKYRVFSPAITECETVTRFLRGLSLGCLSTSLFAVFIYPSLYSRSRLTLRYIPSAGSLIAVSFDEVESSSCSSQKGCKLLMCVGPSGLLLSST